MSGSAPPAFENLLDAFESAVVAARHASSGARRMAGVTEARGKLVDWVRANTKEAP